MEDLKDLFGIKALECFWERFLYAHQVTLEFCNQNWRDKSIQPNRTAKRERHRKSGICPHYGVIELCAEVMGVEPVALAGFDYFCGVIKKEKIGGERHEFSLLTRMCDEIPFRCCSAVVYPLNLAVGLVKSKKPKPVRMISESPSKEEKERILDFFHGQERFELGQKILDLWKTTIPKTIQIEKNPSDSKLVSQAENLLKHLRGYIFAYSTTACESAPKYALDQPFLSFDC